jgi:DNA-binding transcriptional ArsR family regulator
MAQPRVSKHLLVLRQVGAVDVRDEGRRRLYRFNGRAVKPIHDRADLLSGGAGQPPRCPWAP